MNCEEALILISAALDGEITPAEREQLNSHLDRCEECCALAADLGLISAALSREEPVPAGLTGRMERALDGAVQEKKKGSFLRRYGSMAAMLALVVSLGAIVLSGGMGGAKNDAAMEMMFDAEMKAEAPANAAPMPSSEAERKSANGGTGHAITDSGFADVAAGSDADGYDLMPKDEAAGTVQYGGNENESTPLQPPETAEPQFDPPDHATIRAALALVVEELMTVDGMDAPVEEDYYYCVLGRTEDGKQGEETRLEYTGLSSNGKYYTFCLSMHTATEQNSPAEGAEYTTLFNNFAVSRELDEVLREYDENRTVEHLKAYRAALSD